MKRLGSTRMYKNHNPSQRFWEEHEKHLTDIDIRGYVEAFKQHKGIQNNKFCQTYVNRATDCYVPIKKL